jgi:poly-gamma-glutamate capsule biosynthesis protein CapA/YwtB (metallophosphatase superfamily)
MKPHTFAVLMFFENRQLNTLWDSCLRRNDGLRPTFHSCATGSRNDGDTALVVSKLKSRSLILPLLFLLVLYSCKTAKLATTQTSVVDPIIVPLDTLIQKPLYITQKGDTLPSLDLEVDIAIKRLLPDTISIAAVGDIMMGTNYPNKSYLPADNGKFLWNESREILKNADITFGNLEGTILDGEGDPKECNNPKACYLFRMPTSITSNLVDCGFDLMSVANNHANDFGTVGRISTQKTLDSLGIVTAGSIENPYTITKINGMRIGFVAFAPNKGTLGFYDTARAIAIIKELELESDMVIVSIHGGAEGAANQHLTRKREFYFGEDRGNIYEFSHLMIDNGADVIIGHGPHVSRAIEVYKKRIISYSLGNFCTYGRFNLTGANAVAPILISKVSASGEFLTGEIISFKQTYADGPKFDPTLTASRTISKLSQEDFPENEIFVDEKGRIIYLHN